MDFAEYLGDKTYVHGQSPVGYTVVLEIAAGSPPASGSMIRLIYRAADIVVFDADGCPVA